MKYFIAIIKPFKLDDVRNALTEIGVKFAELEVTPKKKSKAKVNSKSDEKSDKLELAIYSKVAAFHFNLGCFHMFR